MKLFLQLSIVIGMLLMYAVDAFAQTTYKYSVKLVNASEDKIPAAQEWIKKITAAEQINYSKETSVIEWQTTKQVNYAILKGKLEKLSFTTVDFKLLSQQEQITSSKIDNISMEQQEIQDKNMKQQEIQTDRKPSSKPYKR